MASHSYPVPSLCPQPVRAASRIAWDWSAPLWWLFLSLAGVACVVLVLPTLIVVVSSFNAARFLTFPPRGFSLQWYEALLRNRQLIEAVQLSLTVAAITVALDLLVGIPAAFALARGRFRGRDLLAAFLLAPLMLPQLVVGLALLAYYLRLGVPLSLPPLVVGHVLVTLPYVVRVATAAVTQLDVAQEEAAASLGANRLQAFWYVMLPRLWPGVAAGSAFAFVSSFDNLDVSLFIAGQRNETLPVKLFQLLVFDIDPVVGAFSTLQIAAVFVLVLVLDRLVGLRRIAA